MASQLVVSVAPRHIWIPPRARSLGSECIAWGRDAGWDLFPWQEEVIEGVLGLDDRDKFVSHDCLVCARQNGKGVILQVIEAFLAFELGYKVVMHTSHEFATSLEHQIRLEAVIQSNPSLHRMVKEKGGYIHANGQESIRLKNGVRIIFKARTAGAGLGYTVDALIWDEAMVIPETVVGAQLPTLRASRAPHGPKIIFAGSAVDQEKHPYGVPFARIREQGLRMDPGVSLFEWSAPYDHIDDMTREVLLDRSWWYLANPSMPEGLIDPDWMLAEIERMDDRTASVMLASVGDWPDTSGVSDMVINPAKWSALADPASEMAGPIILAFDVAPDRSRGTISAGGTREDGNFHLEVVERGEGTGWIAPRLAELVAKHEVDAVVCDSKGPAASLVPEIGAKVGAVREFTTEEYVEACGFLFDTVERAELRHLGQPEVLSAIRGASKRPLGDAWAWSRKNSSTDITPLVSFTLALAVVAEGGGGLVY